MPRLQRPYNRIKETRARPTTSRAMGSMISTHLHQMSSNLQRLPHKPDSPKDGYFNTPTGKRRCLGRKSRSRKEDGSGDEAIGEPTVSSIASLGNESNHSAQVSSEMDHFSKSITELHRAGCFRKEIRMELLEIVDKVDEIDGLHSLIDAEFETRCTVEIFIAKYEEAHGAIKLRCGEDVWRSQQMGFIRTISDEFGHSTSHIILPRPFVVPAEDLFVKRSKKMKHSPDQDYKLGLADQYVVKVWLEAPNSKSRWPPLELESALDPNGRMMIWLREGTFSCTDLRLMCKGVLFPEEGFCHSFGMVLKLGGVQIQTNRALELDIKYSLPPRDQAQLDTPNIHGIESPGEDRQVAETRSPDLVIKTRCAPDSEADDVDMEDNEPVETPFQKPPKSPPLAVPRTKQRLCNAVIKNILNAGEELDAIDDNLEIYWRTAKHVDMIKNRPDIGMDAKDYIIKWDLFVAPLRLSCNFCVPQALLRFVEENKAWFAQQPCRIREFSLHATSLRLRGSIDIEYFVKCINLLRDCIEPPTEVEETNQKAAKHGTDGAADAEDSTDENLLDEVVVDEHTGKCRALNVEPAGEEAWNEKTVYVKSLGEEAVDVELVDEGRMDEAAMDEDVADQDPLATENAKNEDNTHSPQRLMPDLMSRDMDELSANEETDYQDAREDPESLTMDDSFDAEDSEGVLLQPFYFRSCWQSITQRWPRIKLHRHENFGIATVLAAIAIFQGFPNDNIDRLIALIIHHCPNQNIQDLINMYHNAVEVVPEVEGVCMTELKLHRIMWEATRETCEEWLTDVYRLKDESRRTVQDAIETATNADAWDELWERIAQECGR